MNDDDHTPVFTGQAATASVAENSADGTEVVTIAATDADDDTITYTLDDTSDDVFDIDSDGEITVQVESGAALDFEDDDSYTVTVTASDGANTATHDVTVSVTDVQEPPAAPAAPTVTAESATSLEVDWTAPDTTGKPDISGYDVRYRKSGATGWTDHGFSGTETSTTISSLNAGTAYQVQVQATNAEGDSGWSSAGSATTDDPTLTIAAGTSPVTEGTAATFTVTADGAPGTDLTVNLTVSEETGRDFVASGDEGSKTVTIAADATTAAYSVATQTDRTDEPDGSVTVQVATGTGYSVGTAASASVAVNDDDHTPVFTGQDTTASVAENSADGTEVVTIAATDADDDTITYTLDDTSDDVFDIDSDGEITVQVESGAALDFEDDDSHTVTVTASDGANTATHDVTVSVTDVQEPPAAPAAPTVTAESATSLRVTWTAPDTTGKPDITDYDVRYKLQHESVRSWDDHDFTGTGTTTIITDLIAAGGETYEVQVQATNDEGTSPWSATGTGTLAGVSITITGGSGVTEGQAATFTLTAGTAPSADLEVAFRVSEMEGTDFVAEADEGTYEVTIGANTTSATYSVTTQDDDLDEPDGAVTVLLALGSGYVVEDPSSASVAVNDDDHTPVFAGQATTASVAENSADGTGVVTIAATDADDDTITYSLDDASDDVFDIDSAGEITVRVESGSPLDHEGENRYTATVTASDGTNTATHDVTINVTDVDEPPDAPAAPTVTGASTSSVDVAWTAPGTARRPPVTGYNVRYRAAGTTGWTAHGFTGTGTSTTISGLAAGTTYAVQVQAANAEGTGPWSATGSGATDTPANSAPAFDSPPGALDVAENSAAGAEVGTVAATDADGDAIAYSLDSTSDAVFDIDASGVIAVAGGAALDHEATPSYSATVTASDGAAEVTHSLTINVTDVDEPPDAPAAPTVAGSSTTSVDVAWTAPGTAGRPPVTGYDVRYRAAGATGWTGHGFTGTGTGTTISGLAAGTTYAVQVRAANAEGTGPWSATGSGATHSPDNSAPAFDSPPDALDVAENSAAGAEVGTVAATDADGDAVAYSLDSTSDAVFDIDASGVIAVAGGAALDHEATPSYAATVTASDGAAEVTHSLTINVTDVDEPPDAPAAPTVAGASTSSVDVAWTAPDTAGRPPVTGYDVRYRAAGATGWTGHGFTGTGTGTTISGLAAGTTYAVQVRAANAEGTGPWSATSSGATHSPDNSAPAFDSPPDALDVAENSAAGAEVGTVAATDADGDAVAYSLDSTSDAVFDIDASGVIAVAGGAALDHEATPSYAATVTASDGTAAVTHSLTINVTDVDEPPDAPAAPTVAGASPSSVDVAWTAPDTAGRPPVTGYDVRYRAAGTTGWTGHGFTGTGTGTTISGLAAGTTYAVQVRAANAEGTGPWSATGSGATHSPDNSAPAFDSPPDALDVAENSAAGAEVGTVAATDADGDAVAYSLDSTSDAVFDIDASGVIAVAGGAALDHEATPSYAATVTASDGTAAVTHSLTINVTDVDEPPDAPAAPTVAGASPTSVDVAWTAPDTAGRPPVTGYDVRYRAAGTTGWTGHGFTGTGTGTTISGLARARPTRHRFERPTTRATAAGRRPAAARRR